MHIIAILGLPGSGKTEAISYLMEKYGWKKVYFGEVTFDEMKARGLPITPQNERLVREDLRALHGNTYYAKKVIEKLDALETNGESMVLVESLYSWEEYLALKERFGENMTTIVVHAAPTTRYARLAHRPERPLSLEEARSRDYAQIATLSQGGPIAMADFVVINEGIFEQLQERLREIVEKITM
jgi:dephospho-CoA kinase